MTSDFVVVEQFDEDVDRSRILHVAERDCEHFAGFAMPPVSDKSSNFIEHVIIGDHFESISKCPF